MPCNGYYIERGDVLTESVLKLFRNCGDTCKVLSEDADLVIPVTNATVAAEKMRLCATELHQVFAEGAMANRMQVFVCVSIATRLKLSPPAIHPTPSFAAAPDAPLAASQYTPLGCELFVVR